jgi:hypothetical protein
VVSLVFLLDFRIVPTVWYLLFFCYILELFRQCGISCFSVRSWNCSDSVVCLVFLLDFGTVRLCGISCFLLDFGTVPTVWYLLFSVKFCNCSDSVVSLVFLLDFGTLPIVWYLLFFL